MRLISTHGYLVLGAFILASRGAAAELPSCDSNPLILDCFESYSVELRDAHLKQLDAIADDVKKRRGTGAAVHSITIRGHSATWRPTDPVEENARARANRAFHALWSRLVARKVSADKIIFKVVGAADSEPRVSNSTEEGRALNRRVEIDLGGPGGAELAWLEDFHSCKTPYPPYPGTRWLDDPTLEIVRNQKPDGRYGLVRGNDFAQANRLINTLLARWSCEVYRRNLLHPNSSAAAFQPSGRYDKKTEDVVKLFQTLHTGIEKPPGWLDVATLQAMDRWVGIRKPSVRNPARLGDPEQALEVEGESIANPSDEVGSIVAHIFFPTNGVDLESDDLLALQKVVDYWADEQRASRIKFMVLGYADKREPASYNQLLGEERTASVAAKLQELLVKKKVWHRVQLPPFYLGEVERPQLGESADELRRFRRVDVILTDFSSDSCWNCSHKEWKEGVTIGRRGCDALCPKERTPAKMCDPDETAQLWTVRGDIGGVCRAAVKTKGAGAGVCVMTGDLWIEGGPTNKGHFCRAQYAFRSVGAGAGADVPVVCELSKAKLGSKRFSTDKPVSFSDFNGDAIFSSAGLEIGLGYTRSTMRFVQAGKNRSIAPAPKAQWNWGVSTGGLACGAAELHGTLEMLHVPMWRSR